jgi:predicted nucleotidyltransferase
MENKTINLGVVATIAEALQNIKQSVVFVGGAVVSLYTDDPAADEVRPTQDIDFTVNLLNFSNWVQFQEKLSVLGFNPDPFGPSICRYLYKNIPVDIIPAEESPIGRANRWYKLGFKNLQTVLVKEQQIQIFTAPCFLATKFEAFNDRGIDYKTSHDIEDIIYVIDNRINIIADIQNDEPEIRLYLQQELFKIQQLGLLKEILMYHIHPLMRDDRMPIVEEKITRILALY